MAVQIVSTDEATKLVVNAGGSLNTVAVGALDVAIISATGALTLVTGSPAKLWGMFFQNNTATASWIQFFDAATTGAVTLGTTPSNWAAPIPASGTLIVPPAALALLAFVNGIVYAATSTLNGMTTESQSGTVEFL